MSTLFMIMAENFPTHVERLKYSFVQEQKCVIFYVYYDIENNLIKLFIVKNLSLSSMFNLFVNR
jgi:hypothetical protein